jgi:hypothetical protein
MFYAITDSFTGDNPKEYVSGFANTKTAIAFSSAAKRDQWLDSTRLMTAKKITRKEAMDLINWEPGEYYGSYAEKVKPCRIYGTGDGYEAKHIILAESAN